MTATILRDDLGRELHQMREQRRALVEANTLAERELPRLTDAVADAEQERDRALRVWQDAHSERETVGDRGIGHDSHELQRRASEADTRVRAAERAFQRAGDAEQAARIDRNRVDMSINRRRVLLARLDERIEATESRLARLPQPETAGRATTKGPTRT